MLQNVENVANFAQYDCYGGGTVMVWVASVGWIDLILLNRGRLTSQRYVGEILDTRVRVGSRRSFKGSALQISA